MKKRIEVSAPGKLMLFGEHAVMYGYPCIVTAVDQRMTLVALPTKERKLKIEAPGVGVIGYERDLDALGVIASGPKAVSFVETAVKLFQEEYDLPCGVVIETKSELGGSGLGSSSAVAVCTIKALSELIREPLNPHELFDLSYQTVLEVQKTGSGFDVAAAIWGGTIFYLFGGKEIIPLKIDAPVLVVGHSGVKADTPLLIRQVEEKYRRNPEIMRKIFLAMGKLTEEARIALESGEIKKVGELADFNQGLLEAIGISCLELSQLIYAARKAGAYGAKLSGAGGGDCMIAFTDEKNRTAVRLAIQKSGGKIIKVNLNAEGARRE